jgi:hypothetical protein
VNEEDRDGRAEENQRDTSDSQITLEMFTIWQKPEAKPAPFGLSFPIPALGGPQYTLQPDLQGFDQLLAPPGSSSMFPGSTPAMPPHPNDIPLIAT